MPRRRLIGCRIAVMPRTEVLTTPRIVLFDGHIWVTESDLHNITIIVLHVHSTLLALAWSVERFVERHLLSLIGVTFFRERGHVFIFGNPLAE